VRGDEINKLTGINDFRVLPQLWEMALVARDKKICTPCIGAFDEDVVFGVRGNVQRNCGSNEVGAVFDELQELASLSFGNAQFRTR